MSRFPYTIRVGKEFPSHLVLLTGYRAVPTWKRHAASDWIKLN
jgi:hypothetical protein